MNIPQAISSIIGIGHLVQYYPPKGQKLFKWGMIGAAVLGLGGGIAVLLIGVLQTYWSYYYHGPSVVLKNLIVPSALGLLLLAAGFLTARVAYVRGSRCAAIFDLGLVFQDLEGRHIWRWEDFSSIRLRLTRNLLSGNTGKIHHVYILAKSDGERIILDDSLENVEDLAENIRAIILPALYKTYSTSFFGGKRLEFGPISIDREKGMSLNGRQFLWGQVLRVEVQKGKFEINTSDGNQRRYIIKIPVADIPALEICLSLMDQMLALKTIQQG